MQNNTMVYLVKGFRKIQVYHVNCRATINHIHQVIKDIKQR